MQLRSSSLQNTLLDNLRLSLSELEPTPLSHQRFDQSHEWFEGQSNQQGQILDWLCQRGASRIEQRGVVPTCNRDPYRVLSVGCGSGILDRPLMQAWAGAASTGDAPGEIHYTAFDPNPVACQRFRDEFGLLELPAVELSVMEETVESYAASESFDFTHVVHALYYFEDPAASIQALMQRVADDGELVIFQAPKAELNLLADCFWKEHSTDPIWFSRELDEHLCEQSIPFERTRLDAEVDVTACFQDGCPEGNLTLDFLVQSDCETLPREARAEVLEYLRAISREDQQRILAPHPVDVFTLPANCDQSEPSLIHCGASDAESP